MLGFNLSRLSWFNTYCTELSLIWSCLVAHSCLTLCDPMNGSLPDSFVHGIFQANILEWVAMPSSSGSSWPRDAITGRQSLYPWTKREAWCEKDHTEKETPHTFREKKAETPDGASNNGEVQRESPGWFCLTSSLRKEEKMPLKQNP